MTHDEEYLESNTIDHDRELFKTLSKIYPSYEIQAGQLELEIFDYDKICNCSISGGTTQPIEDQTEDISGYYDNSTSTPILVAGAPARKSSNQKRKQAMDLLPFEEIAQNANIMKTARDVLKYIYSAYPQAQRNANQLTIDFIVSAINEGSFTNIRKDDYPRLISAVLAEHTKAYDGVRIAHPFHYLMSNIPQLENAIEELESTLDDHAYSTVVRDVHLQSVEYEPANLEKLLLTYDTDSLINPLLYAFYYHKLPLIEKLTIECDAFSLLKNILKRKDKLKSTNAN